MVDLHCHILPGLDDGAEDMDDALEMCRIAHADGIHTIVATPHCKNGVYDNNETTILPVLHKLQEAVNQEGIPIRLIPSAEIHIHPELITFLEENQGLLLGGRYVALELPGQFVPPYAREFLFKMRLKGYTPIITHPERNSVVQANPEMFEEWVRGGVLVQVTAMSITGEFGNRVRKCALQMVRAGLVHLIATDAHLPHWRPPVLSKGRKVLEKLVGHRRAEAMVKDIPEKILKGEVVEEFPIAEPQYQEL